MKNVKSFMLGAALLLAFVGFSPEISAHTLSVHPTISCSPQATGTTVVVQGRKAAEVILDVEGAIQLTMTDEGGNVVLSETVPVEGSYIIVKADYPVGTYQLVADTAQNGRFIFTITVD